MLLAGAVVAGGFALTAPASAYCAPVLVVATGYCNPCYATRVPWDIADDASGGALGPMHCLD